MMELDLASGKSRGYWKYHIPEKWSKQAKAVGKIKNEKSTMGFDSGAEISSIDTTFARKVGWVVDEIRTKDFVGIEENEYIKVERTNTKVTLDESLVYYFDVWVGD